MSQIKYIEVAFGDNDFAWPVERALRRLFGFIKENNYHMIENSYISTLFTKLFESGALQSLIERLYCLEYLASDIEFKTRGLHYESDIHSALYKGKKYVPKTEWKESIVKDAGIIDFKNTYLSIDVFLHTNKKFKNKWHNSEHAFLNIRTGEVSAF